ncbi:ankyrin repeat domain-containing protein 26-like isoform X2 [Bos indicus x Bos taurus]|uniref:ankyrin repeat domain-containing protein 26-like isoform X2 n=1 Tax=Bos indicus x Bos taurus TaxID=30522 RepID=UPI000F7D570E|nr:ankyrin repeat domain-containing protein 26-like isoform X2 [Bos indicus x Bos taurus]
MNQQMSSDFFFNKVLTSFLKMFLDGLWKNMLLLVVLILDESSEEDSSRRFPNKPGIDLGPTSNDEVLDFKTKHVLKSKLTKLMKASQQSKRNIEAKCGILRPESTTFSQNNNSDSNVEDVVETFPKPSSWFEGIYHPAFPLPEPVSKLLKSVAGLGRTKSISESLPQKYVDHLPGTAGQRGKKTLNGQVEVPGIQEQEDQHAVPRSEVMGRYAYMDFLQ